MRGVDLVFVNPSGRSRIYQELGEGIAAVEPPYWCAVTAAWLRNQGVSVAIVDADGEGLTPEGTARRVAELSPLLACIVVAGHHPSASTQTMPAAIRFSHALKESWGGRVAVTGLHPSVLPLRTLEETGADFVVVGEGFTTLRELVGAVRSKAADLSAVPGLFRRDGDRVRSTPPPPLQTGLDHCMPLAAWDLLPMGRYRAHNWHCFDDPDHRFPYAAIYTSLGCPYSCLFCCINAPFGKPGIRYRSPSAVVDELAHLHREYGVRNVKISDELFIFDPSHHLPIVDGIARLGLSLNVWAYARIDGIDPSILPRLRKGGITWLALGIESGSGRVRQGARKGWKGDRDVRDVVRAIRDEGIRVIGNFIFGLPDDTMETMEETLSLALELKCEFVNFYCAMAYPGSKLYDLAVKEGWELPGSWEGYSQHSYETHPLPTKHLTAPQVLRFRDEAFHRYFSDPGYLEMVETTFGSRVRRQIEEMAAIRLKRRLLGD